MATVQEKTVEDGISEREMYELKEAALKYYTENGVTEKMEEILNSMFFANPDDVYGHLSNFFATFCKTPTIRKFDARCALDSKGETALHVDVYSKVKNAEKCMSSCTISNRTNLRDAWKIEDKEADDQRRDESINQAISFITDQISQKLCGVNLSDQENVDEEVYSFIALMRREKEEALAQERGSTGQSPAEQTPPPAEAKKPAKSPKGKKSVAPAVVTPDQPAELPIAGCELISAVSMAVCEAAARAADRPLYEYIAALRGEEHVEKFRIPLPVVTILQGGKSSPGKHNCVKEFMVCSCPGTSLAEGIQKIQAIQATVFKNLFAKAGASLRSVSELGAVTPLIDRPEQGLDLIQDAANQLGYTAGTDYNIILQLCGRDIFDYDKGRYEVITGQLKLPEEMADFYADIINRYQSVIGIIDPIRTVEKEAWYKLCEKVSERVYVFDEEGHGHPGSFREILRLTDHSATSGVVFKYDTETTVSHLIQCTNLLTDQNNRVMLSTNVGETADTYLADLAVGLGAHFIRVGGLTRGERVNKLNRLLQIEAEVTSLDKLDTMPEHEFPKISAPEIPDDPEAAEAATSVQDSQSNSSPRRK